MLERKRLLPLFSSRVCALEVSHCMESLIIRHREWVVVAAAAAVKAGEANG